MREKYIKMRNKKILTFNILFESFKEIGGTLSQEQFLFGVNNLGNTKEIINRFDSHFKVTSLYNSKNQFIRCW